MVDKLPTVFRLSMSINEQTLGKTRFDKNSMVSSLSAKQVAALIAALKGTSEIHWTDGENWWELSNQGAAAVLLKMDEYQGRIGTQGALMRKGPKGEEQVLPPVARSRSACCTAGKSPEPRPPATDPASASLTEIIGKDP